VGLPLLCFDGLATPIAAILAPIAAVLAPVAAIFCAIPHVLATIAPVFEAVAPAAVVAAVAHVLARVTAIFAAVGPILGRVPPILAPIPYVFSSIAAVLHAGLCPARQRRAEHHRKSPYGQSSRSHPSLLRVGQAAPATHIGLDGPSRRAVAAASAGSRIYSKFHCFAAEATGAHHHDTMKLAQRMSRLGTESAFEVLARARALEAQGRHVIHLEIGQPDFPTPSHIKDAAKKALDEGWTGYGPTAGLPECREAIAQHVSATRGIDVGVEHVCVVPGGKPIMYFVMTALLEPGDEVIYPTPGFPIYESLVDFLGARRVPMPLVEERGFSFDLDLFERSLSPRTRLVILNSPGNPTGGVIPRADLARIADLVRDRDLIVLSDEIYSRIWYDERPESIAQFDGLLPKTVILDGFSKTYSMTGWRLGYGVMPTWLAAAVERLMVNSNSCTASFTQRAGVAALQGPQDCVDAMVAEFRRRRDAMVAGLNAIPGFRCAVPAGAFYAFPNVRGTGLDSRTLADLLLNQAGVSCLSGTAFGDYGDGYLRFSYANSLENIELALGRIQTLAGRWASAKGFGL
jgi:aspartate aminotransferase